MLSPYSQFLFDTFVDSTKMDVDESLVSSGVVHSLNWAQIRLAFLKIVIPMVITLILGFLPLGFLFQKFFLLLHTAFVLQFFVALLRVFLPYTLFVTTKRVVCLHQYYCIEFPISLIEEIQFEVDRISFDFVLKTFDEKAICFSGFKGLLKNMSNKGKVRAEVCNSDIRDVINEINIDSSVLHPVNTNGFMIKENKCNWICKSAHIYTGLLGGLGYMYVQILWHLVGFPIFTTISNSFFSIVGCKLY